MFGYTRLLLNFTYKQKIGSMTLTAEQLNMLREPFDRIGAFDGRSEDEIKKLIEGIADIYVTLAEVNLRLKQKNRTDKKYE